MMHPYTVQRVIDGDTFEVTPSIPRSFALQSHFQESTGLGVFNKVRLANINAPESRKIEGKLATIYLKSLIEGKQVLLKPIGVSYDRVVADVWTYPNNLYVNAILISRGYAKQA